MGEFPRNCLLVYIFWGVYHKLSYCTNKFIWNFKSIEWISGSLVIKCTHFWH